MTTTKNPDHALLSAEQLRALLARAREALDARGTQEEEEDEEESAQLRRTGRYHRWIAAREALQFVMAEAAAQGDTSMLAEVEGVLAAMEHFDDTPTSVLEVVSEAAGRLAGLESRPSVETRRLARHPFASVRYHVALGLGPTSAEHIALLQQLAMDGERRVREAASGRLGKEHALPWWSGLFNSDPMSRLSHVESARVGKTLAAIRELNTGTWWARGTTAAEQKQWPRLVAALPDVLALEVGERLLRTERLSRETKGAVFASMLSRRDVLPCVLRYVDHGCERLENRFAVLDVGAHAAKVAPRAAAHAVAFQLAELAAAAPPLERHDHHSVAAQRAALAQALWSKRAPPEALLELVLRVHQDDDEKHSPMDWVGAPLASALCETTANVGPLMPRILEALAQGAPGPWRGLAHRFSPWVDALPRARVRAAALKAMQSQDPTALRWGLQQFVLHGTQVRSKDGPPLACLERLWEVPAMRKELMDDASLREACVVPLRRLLRSGACTPVEAECAAAVVSSLYGGAARPNMFSMNDDEDREEKALAEQRKLQSELRPYLGPSTMRGPLDDAEWEVLRAARRAVLADGSWTRERKTFRTQPAVRHPEDQRQLREAISQMAPGRADGAMDIALALNCNPAQEDLPAWEALLAVVDAEDRTWIRKCYQRSRMRMGLPASPPAPAGAVNKEDDGWDDDD